MAKGDSMSAVRAWNIRSAPVNIGERWPDADAARLRVLNIQTKLHQWAGDTA